MADGNLLGYEKGNCSIVTSAHLVFGLLWTTPLRLYYTMLEGQQLNTLFKIGLRCCILIVYLCWILFERVLLVFCNSSVLCFPLGSLKLPPDVSTPTLTFLLLLIFSHSKLSLKFPSPEIFLLDSPLWCKHFVLGVEKAVERNECWETYYDTWMQAPPPHSPHTTLVFNFFF